MLGLAGSTRRTDAVNALIHAALLDERLLAHPRAPARQRKAMLMRGPLTWRSFGMAWS